MLELLVVLAVDIGGTGKGLSKYAKYLVRLPLWTSNSTISTKYGVTSPLDAIQRRTESVPKHKIFILLP